MPFPTLKSRDVSSHPISISDVSTQSGDRDQELSGDEAPQSVHVDLVTPTSPPAPARVQQFIQICSPVKAGPVLHRSGRKLVRQ